MKDPGEAGATGRAIGAAFDLPPTSWSLLGEMARPDGGRAMAEFARRYHGPVVAYLTVLTGDGERASDLAQAFFEQRILSGNVLARADRSRGGFRGYLKSAIRNFCRDRSRYERRQKRGGDRVHAPLEAIGELSDPRDAMQPERAFHVAWVRSLLETALRVVQEQCAARGQDEHFRIFASRYLAEDGGTPSWAAVGGTFGLDEKAARGRAETVARRFRTVLRGLIEADLVDGGQIDAELATLRLLL